MKKKFSQKISRLFAGRGFYIALMVCVAAVGIGVLAVGVSGIGGPGWGQPTENVFNPHTPAAQSPIPSPTPGATAPLRVWPIAGDVELPFSMDALIYNPTLADWRTHAGVDISGKTGDSVGALTAGTVTAVEKGGAMGVTVRVDHGGGVASAYSNLAEDVSVKTGDRVFAGQKLGTIGDTAVAESGCAPHLHLEVSINGQNTDPMAYLPKK